MVFACVGAMGCQVLSGLDEDRDIDPSCQPNARRCNGATLERCDSTGNWSEDQVCPVACVGDSCRDALVTTGHHHTCVRRTDGSIWCWGQADFAETTAVATEICIDDHLCSPTPYRLESLTGARAISSLAHHTCVVLDGNVRCWGDNAHGQLGTTPVEDVGLSPVQVKFPLDVTVVDVQAGGGHVGGPESQLLRAGHTCALTESGELYCWGANCAGQLGLGVGVENQCPVLAASCPVGSVATNLSIPTRVNLPFRAIQAGVGAAHTCALSEQGEVWCWGFNHYGQVGVLDTDQCVIEPTRVPGLRRITQIALGALQTCARSDQQKVFCWGRTQNELLGRAFDGISHGPVLIADAPAAVDVGTGHGTHACARDGEGGLYCWGENENAEIGVIDSIDAAGHVSPTPLPVTLVPVNSVSTFDTGGNHTCAWDATDKLWCWGENGIGALGTGAIGSPSVPTQAALP